MPRDGKSPFRSPTRRPMSFLHTPYASGKPPFAIGLAPLDPERWIEPLQARQAMEHFLRTVGLGAMD